jgi:hypothetical protein
LAVRSALNEAYALGNINSDYVDAGGNPVFNNTDVWASQLLVSGGPDPRAAAAGLIAEVYPGIDDPNVWGYNIVGPPGSTPWEADGFYIDIFPEGTTGWVGKPMIIITFKMSHLDFEPADSRSALDDAMHDANFDPNAGYYVYHVIGDAD